MEVIKKIIIQSLIIEMGTVSYLTQGAENGWFEYGRPGHPKHFKPPYKNDNNLNKGKKDEKY